MSVAGPSTTSPRYHWGRTSQPTRPWAWPATRGGPACAGGLHALNQAYAAAEAGDYTRAFEEYKAAGDAAAIVRLLLGPLQQPGSAADLARHSGSKAALRQVADHLLQGNQPAVRSPELQS